MKGVPQHIIPTGLKMPTPYIGPMMKKIDRAHKIGMSGKTAYETMNDVQNVPAQIAASFVGTGKKRAC